MRNPKIRPVPAGLRQSECAHSEELRATPSTGTGLVRIAPGLLGKTSRLRSLGLWAIGVASFLMVVLVALHFGSLAKMIEMARSARPGWLLVALVAQGATYFSAAFVWHRALQRAGHPLLNRAGFVGDRRVWRYAARAESTRFRL